MNEPKAPTTEELKRYVAQISFLRQIRSLSQDINAEQEQFNRLLEEQKERVRAHDGLVQDLSSTICECEEDFQRLIDKFAKGEALLEDTAESLSNISRSDEEVR